MPLKNVEKNYRWPHLMQRLTAIAVALFRSHRPDTYSRGCRSCSRAGRRFRWRNCDSAISGNARGVRAVVQCTSRPAAPCRSPSRRPSRSPRTSPHQVVGRALRHRATALARGDQRHQRPRALARRAGAAAPPRRLVVACASTRRSRRPRSGGRRATRPCGECAAIACRSRGGLQAAERAARANRAGSRPTARATCRWPLPGRARATRRTLHRRRRPVDPQVGPAPRAA